MDSTQNPALSERFTYLQDGRPRVGRSRHLIDFLEMGSRVALALEIQAPRLYLGDASSRRGRLENVGRPSTWAEREGQA
jgi:hypothetical protein